MISASVEDPSVQPDEPLHAPVGCRTVNKVLSRDLVLSLLAGDGRLNPRPRASARTQTLILLFLHASAGEDGVSRVSRNQLAAGIQVGRSAMHESLDALREVGTVDVAGRGEALEIRVNHAGAPGSSAPPIPEP